MSDLFLTSFIEQNFLTLSLIGWSEPGWSGNLGCDVFNLFWLPVLASLIYFRLVYWISLNTCSAWRGFGSGLTVFPLLAMVALNLFLMYVMNFKEPLFGSQDVLFNQVTPSSWLGETSQSPSGKPDILPTVILDSQWGGKLHFLLSEEEIFPKIVHSCGSAFRHSYKRCHYNNLQVWLNFCSSYTKFFLLLFWVLFVGLFVFNVDSCLLSELQEVFAC